MFYHYNEFLILYEFVCRFLRETNNWIRLLIFDNKSQFLFSQPIPKHIFGLL